MKYFGWIVIVVIAIFIMGVLMNTCNTANKMVDNGFETVYEEFKPEELLRKYEWFKDASSQCDQKLSTLKSYESRFNVMKQSYGSDSLNRRNWERSDLEQWNIWQSEFLGVKSSYNDLSAQYNAAMVKFNYGFCNAGQLPKGADMPLPREFKPYINY